MDILFATIAPKQGLGGAAGQLQELYLQRCQRYGKVEAKTFKDEESLLRHLDGLKARTRPGLFLTDSRGKTVTSEEFAGELRKVQENGVQVVCWAVGPADGWSEAARKRADLMVSFGRITLPHELAAVVAAEQLYRAFTILAGHPYHSGH